MPMMGEWRKGCPGQPSVMFKNTYRSEQGSELVCPPQPPISQTAGLDSTTNLISDQNLETNGLSTPKLMRGIVKLKQGSNTSCMKLNIKNLVYR
jgi:hypothetical protein